MRLPFNLSSVRLAGVICAITVLSACGGGGLSGTYKTSNSMVDTSLTFKSGGKFEITTMGTTQEGTWVMDGKRVKMTVGASTQIMDIDDKGCLNMGDIMGKACKSDK